MARRHIDDYFGMGLLFEKQVRFFNIEITHERSKAMNAEIIAVGSELLLGQISNTNAQYLSKQLADLGVNVYFHTVVGDNRARLTQAVSQAQSRADFVIFTGGLGPTKDDLTKETVAQSVGRNLVYDDISMRGIHDYFAKTKRVMTENNKKQALVIDGAEVLANDHGMAPGMAFEENGITYMLLPGPPRELEPMFRVYGLAYLRKRLGTPERIVSRVLRFFGIGESQLETEIDDLIDEQTNPTIAPLAGNSEVTLRITAKNRTPEQSEKMIDELETKILNRVGTYFYGYGHTTLQKEVFHLLQEKGLSLSCAESLTGGSFSKDLTDLPGASDVFKGGIVCYTNKMKEKILHVPAELLETEGAVSKACAKSLAQNVKDVVATDIGISFTGVAGPSKSEQKDVGTVFIGIAGQNGKTDVHQLQLAGGRQGNRKRAVLFGYFYLLKRLARKDE
jgi:nicotinamide-nucleotide amidase